MLRDTRHTRKSRHDETRTKSLTGLDAFFGVAARKRVVHPGAIKPSADGHYLH